MFKFSSKNKKESKNEKVVSNSMSFSKSDGDIVTTSSMSSMTRQTSSSSHTSEITRFEGWKPDQAVPPRRSFVYGEKSHNDNSFFNFNMPYAPKPATDAKPFKTKPSRSAFTSEPLTMSTSLPAGSLLSSSLFVNNRRPLLSIQPEDFNNKINIKVTKSNKFYDDPAESKVPVYKTRSKSRGKLLLINNINFINEKAQRDGAELDELNVIKLFKEIGFEVVKHRNLSKKKMQNEILNFRDSKSLKKVDIGSVIVMSHGTGQERSDSTQVVCADEQMLDTTWIVNQFDSTLCEHLAGKPKIFIFQCCRGNYQDVQHDSVPISPPRRLSDMLLAYSTIPGFVSHRDPKNGTWYMQAVCKVFMEHSHDTDVENLLKIVDSTLSNLVSTGSKQTSSFENRGFKTCFLHPKLSE